LQQLPQLLPQQLAASSVAPHSPTTATATAANDRNLRFIALPPEMSLDRVTSHTLNTPYFRVGDTSFDLRFPVPELGSRLRMRRSRRSTPCLRRMCGICPVRQYRR
jgi:hypothetical protein